MTERDKFEIQEQRQAIFARDGYICQTCGYSIFRQGTPQLAHCIAQTKANIAKYGKEVIHHGLNQKSVCSLFCNDAQNIGNNPKATEALVEAIKKAGMVPA